MAQEALTSGEYIAHHLQNLTLCRADGHWVWNECHGNFWAVNVDSMFFSVVLGLTFAAIFGSVFVAELGDKTQLATMLFAARGEVSKWQVFLGSSCALLLSTALGVLAGQAISGVVDERTLRWIAGCSFLAIGLWTLLRG